MPSEYDEDYFSSVYGVGQLRRFSSAWFSARFYAAVSRRLLRLAGGRRVLEIGCGLGFVLAFLRDEFAVTGVDLSEYAIECAARRVPRGEFLLARLEEGIPAELAGRQFDLVLAKYVLEHLENPGTAIRAAFELLRPGGFFFLSVPNTQSIGQRLKGEEWYARKDPTHVSLLEPEEWLRLVADAAFSLWKETSDGYWDLPYVRGVPLSLQALFFLPPTALICLTGRPLLPKRFGENLLIIARKPEGRA